MLETQVWFYFIRANQEPINRLLRELTNPGYVGTITNLKSSSQNPKMEHFNPTLPPPNSSIIPVTGKPEYPHRHTWA